MQRLLQRYFLTLSLRKKTLAIVGSTLGALIVVLYVITSLVDVKGHSTTTSVSLASGCNLLEIPLQLLHLFLHALPFRVEPFQTV